jgi:hypothetical protein
MMYQYTKEQHQQVVDALMCGVIALNHHNLPLECAPLHEARLMLKAMQPVASIYVATDGSREFDDWRCDLPMGRTELYAAPVAQKENT